MIYTLRQVKCGNRDSSLNSPSAAKILIRSRNPKCTSTGHKINLLSVIPRFTQVQFGSTVARQEIHSDSDVVSESNQIQGLLKTRNNSPPNFSTERNTANLHEHNV